MGFKEKKKLIFQLTVLILIFIMIFSLSGCLISDLSLKIGEGISNGVSTAADKVNNDSNSETDEGEENKKVLAPGENFGYSNLNKKEKKVYDKIAKAIGQQDEVVHNLGISDEDTLFKIIDFISMDHPEFFWWETGGKIKVSKLLGLVVDVSMEFEYTLTKEEVEKYSSQIDEIVSSFISSLSPDLTDYEKVLAVYEYIIKKVDYNMDSEYNQTILSVLVGDQSVCSGYSKTMQYLLIKLGVFCSNIVGSVSDRAHSWNLVAIDGEYYYVDPTWGDPIFSADLEGENLENDISYDYLCITTEEIKKTHVFDFDEIMPICDSHKFNYFNVNGRYFNEYSIDTFQSVIDKTAESGESFVAVKFASEEAFNTAYEDLVTNRQIFSILKKARKNANNSLKTSTMSYAVNQNFNIIKLSFEYS